MFHVVKFFYSPSLPLMRMLRSVEDVGGRNLVGKSRNRLAPVRNMWNEWEIHCLILASLALQVLLFFAGGMRRRSTSRVLSIVLWLAYLSADSVAIFVLGHLAVRGASGLEHELLLFWAPFLLVHLGGQDTITALSVQDNELWTRHLLGFVSQVAVAGYVVSRSSWPDKRLLAATMLVFLAGSLKYAGRTYCLYFARPANVKVHALRSWSDELDWMKEAAALVDDQPGFMQYVGTSRDEAIKWFNDKFELMNGKVNPITTYSSNVDKEIVSADAPLNDVESLLVAEDLPGMLEIFQNTSSSLHWPYEYAGRKLLSTYERFYTKIPLLYFYERALLLISWGSFLENWHIIIILLTTAMFQYLSTPIALVLFILAEKGHQVHSRADITLSYILLLGAIILDVSSVSMSIISSVRSGRFDGENRIQKAILRVANHIQPEKSKKLWSEKLAQYSMVKRYTLEDTRGKSSVRHWIIERLTASGVELLDPSLTHTPVTEYLKGFVLNSLVQFGTNKQYNVANFRGLLALQNWRPNGPGTTALYHSIIGVKDFPKSILIWHIATDICYYCENSKMGSADSERLTKKKQMTRQLSNYILYLVFKCGVMLTSKSQLVGNNVHLEMERVLGEKQARMVNLGEKEVITTVFEGTRKDEQQPWIANVKQKQHMDTDNATTSLKELLKSTAEAIYSPVLPCASKVAEELMSIKKESERWDLMAEVWTEMLLYTAPRCGGGFHYKHLATGGEFITHVLLLMRSLGPFLPGPDSSAP